MNHTQRLYRCEALALACLVLIACSSDSGEPTCATGMCADGSDPEPTSGDGEALQMQEGGEPNESGQTARDSSKDPPNRRAPEVLYPLFGANLSGIHLVDRTLWWRHGSTIVRAPSDGSGTPESLVQASGGATNRFAHDDTHVYWLADDRIVRVPKAGRSTEEWLLGGSFAFGGFSMRASDVLVTNAFAAELLRMPRGGGDLTTVATLNTSGDQGGGALIATFGDAAYVSYLGEVFRVDLTDATVVSVAMGLKHPSRVVQLGDAFYFLNTGVGQDLEIYRYRHPGESERIYSNSDGGWTTRLLSDEARGEIYYFPATLGPLVAFKPETGVVRKLTETLHTSRELAADADYIYWLNVDPTAPGVMRVHKDASAP